MADKKKSKSKGEMLSDEQLLEQFRDDKTEAKEGQNHWIRNALKAYRFYHGDQWDDGDLKILYDQNRPAITFNRIKPFVQVVVGTMIQTRGVPKYLPRDTSDRPRADIFNSAASWAREQSRAEHFEMKAAKDMLICGKGVTDERISYDNGVIHGTMVKERIYPLEVYSDPTARQMNLLDARYHIRVKHLTKRDFKDSFGKYPDEVIGVGEEDMTSLTVDYYDEDTFRRKTGRYTVFEYQYRQKEEFYWVQNPAFTPDSGREVNPQEFLGVQGGEQQAILAELGLGGAMGAGAGAGSLMDVVEETPEVEVAREFAERFGKSVEEPVFSLTPEENRIYRALMAEIDLEVKTKKAKRWRYYQAFMAGDEVLEHHASPIPDGFTFKFMTGDFDDEKCLHYGLVQAMIDPARYANKAFSQHLHIMNTQPKGGLLIERGATDNISKLEKQYAKHDSIIEVNQGALSSGKIKDKAQPTQPTGFELVLNIAQGAHREVTGINLELLGQADRAQAGVLEATRIQQGMTVMAEYIDSFRLYLKETGKTTIHFMRELTSNVDGLLFRIVGADEGKYERLFANDIAPYYDIVVNEAPQSPNQDKEDLDAIAGLLQTGVVPPLRSLTKGVVEKAPIRQALKDEAIQELQEAMQQPQANPQQEAVQNEAIMLEREQKMADIRKTNAEAEETKADTFKKQAETALKAADTRLKKQDADANTMITGL